MRPIATDVAPSVVCVSVCALVTRKCCAKTAEPIEMPLSCGPKKPCIIWRLRSPTTNGNFRGCPAQESVWSLCCGACSKRDHSILNNRRSQPTVWFHVTLSLVKNPPHPHFCFALFVLQAQYSNIWIFPRPIFGILFFARIPALAILSNTSYNVFSYPRRLYSRRRR